MLLSQGGELKNVRQLLWATNKQRAATACCGQSATRSRQCGMQICVHTYTLYICIESFWVMQKLFVCNAVGAHCNYDNASHIIVGRRFFVCWPPACNSWVDNDVALFAKGNFSTNNILDWECKRKYVHIYTYALYAYM